MLFVTRGRGAADTLQDTARSVYSRRSFKAPLLDALRDTPAAAIAIALRARSTRPASSVTAPVNPQHRN